MHTHKYSFSFFSFSIYVVAVCCCVVAEHCDICRLIVLFFFDYIIYSYDVCMHLHCCSWVCLYANELFSVCAVLCCASVKLYSILIFGILHSLLLSFFVCNCNTERQSRVRFGCLMEHTHSHAQG